MSDKIVTLEAHVNILGLREKNNFSWGHVVSRTRPTGSEGLDKEEHFFNGSPDNIGHLEKSFFFNIPPSTSPFTRLIRGHGPAGLESTRTEQP